MIRKSQENRKAQFRKFCSFVSHKSIFRRYCIQNVKDGIQIQVCKINKEIITHFN